MRKLLPALLVLLAPLGAAQSLAQLSIGGSLVRASRVEVEVGAMVAGEARRLDVHVFLAAGTSGSDLAVLVARRLEASGFRAYLGGSAGAPGPRALFIEEALFVNARVGDGLLGTVTSAEAAPSSLRVVAGEGADLDLALSAAVVNPATRVHSTVSLRVPLQAGMHAAKCSEALMRTAAGAGWASDRPGSESWRPIRLADGSRFVGFSVEAPAGCRVELRLVEAPE